MRPQAASLTARHGHSFGANAEVFMNNFLQKSLGRERKACAFPSGGEAEGLFSPTNLISAAGKYSASSELTVTGSLLTFGRDNHVIAREVGKRLHKVFPAWRPSIGIKLTRATTETKGIVL